MKLFQGNLKGEDITVAIVVSRFNSFITERLLEGAIDGLERHGVKKEDIDIVKVPGEIPLVAKKLAQKNYDGIICLGCVIRGSTPHFDYVANEVSKGVALVSIDKEKPIIFGVLTTDTIEQAIERAGTKAGNKGYDAALSLIETVNLIKEI